MRILGGFTHVKVRYLALFFVLMLVSAYISPVGAQTRKSLTNQDVIDMTKQALAPSIIVKAIEANQTDFDVSAQALLDLKNAGVDSSVMEAMLSVRGNNPSSSVEALPQTAAPRQEPTSRTRP